MNVTIDKLAERRLWAFIRAKSVEVGGMGYAFLEQDGSVHVREVFLIPQEVSSSEVDFEKTNGDVAFVERALADGVLTEPNFVPFSWHSHHTMDAYWSATDDKRIAAMSKVGVKRLLSFVGCHDGNYELRLDAFDVRAHDVDLGQVTVSKLSLTREVREPDEFEREIKAELDANVKTKTYTQPFISAATDGKKSRSRDRLDERRIASELTAEGYSATDAQGLIDSLGLDDCELLLDGGFVQGISLGIRA